MLNTDAHKPDIKVKMTELEFIKNNRGMNGGKDFTKEFLSDLYYRIVYEEISEHAGPTPFPNGYKKGWGYVKSEALRFLETSHSSKSKPHIATRPLRWMKLWLLLTYDVNTILYCFTNIGVS